MTSLCLMRLSDWYQIPIWNFSTKNKKAFCVENNIVIDFCRVETERECKELLSEEIGHVLCRAMYPLSFCGDRLRACNIQKQESRAMRCAARIQVPLIELKKALARTSDEYEVAEMLDVSVETLQQAVSYYRAKGLLAW